MIDGVVPPEAPTLDERIDTAVAQFELAASVKGERLACLEARRHFAWYLKGIPHSSYYRAQAVHVETLEDILKLAKQIKRELR